MNEYCKLRLMAYTHIVEIFQITFSFYRHILHSYTGFNVE